MYSGDRWKVFCEADRVLKTGGCFIFTDIMQRAEADPEALRAVYGRIHLDSLGHRFIQQGLRGGFSPGGWCTAAASFVSRVRVKARRAFWAGRALKPGDDLLSRDLASDYHGRPAA